MPADSIARVEIQTSPGQVALLWADVILARYRWYLIALALTSGMLAIAPFDAPWKEPAAIAVAALLLVRFFRLGFAALKVYRAAKRHPFSSGRLNVEFSDSGILRTSGDHSEELDWADFRGWSDHRGNLLLWLDPWTFTFVPLPILDPEDAEKIAKLATSKLSKFQSFLR